MVADKLLSDGLKSRLELIDKFGWEEYLTFGTMFFVSLIIGVIFYCKGQKNNNDLLLGGKSMKTLPMSMSLIASFMSAITLLGTPAEVYVYGTQYLALVLSYPMVMFSTICIFVPIFRTLNVSTSYEYLEWRFNKSVRIQAAACFVMQMVIYMAIVVYTPSLAISQITGISVDFACALIFGVCILYTAIGGIKAVMWTDTFQVVIMFASFLAVIIKGNHDTGGFSVVFRQNYISDRIEFFDFDFNLRKRHSVWTMFIGGYFMWLSVYGINQTQVQRYMSVPSIKSVKKALWWNMIGIGSLLLMCGYGGLVVYAYYSIVKCDPIAAKQVDKRDQIFPFFVMQVMGDIPFVPGILVAGVFSGTLSSVSSGLNSLAAVALQDILLTGFGIKLKESKGILLSRTLAIFFGAISYGLIFFIKLLPGVLEAVLGIFGIIGGPVLGTFVLGVMIPWTNSTGAFIGTLSSLILTMWIGFGQTVAKNFGYIKILQKSTTVEGCPVAWLNVSSIPSETFIDNDQPKSGFFHLSIYEISYMWFTTFACLSCVVIGLIVSLISGPQSPRKLNPILICSPAKRFYNVLSKRFRCLKKHLQIGTEFISGTKEVMIISGHIGNDNLEEEIIQNGTSTSNP